MPPNLGGFFMVRSYYPSECHADYFDFERIEALKPAIEACGISTLSQSPMLGFHKQMDNRIKLLEEILSFRMQGVEFDNGDMYVDGHKAASYVRDEFVSVTEKLMDELAQCYNVLPQLDINNTIDHRPEGLVHQQTQNQRYGSSHIGATAKDISNVVTDAASGVVDIFHGIDKAVADTWNNFWKDGKADGIGSNLSRK